MSHGDARTTSCCASACCTNSHPCDLKFFQLAKTSDKIDWMAMLASSVLTLPSELADTVALPRGGLTRKHEKTIGMAPASLQSWVSCQLNALKSGNLSVYRVIQEQHNQEVHADTTAGITVWSSKCAFPFLKPKPLRFFELAGYHRKPFIPSNNSFIIF